MLAVIETGGKQYLVKKGDEILVEKLDTKVGAQVQIRVLLAYKDKEILIGRPVVKEVKVKAKLKGQEKGKKLIIFKYKRRKKYRRKIGHRQQYSRIKIESIKL